MGTQPQSVGASVSDIIVGIFFKLGRAALSILDNL